MLPAKVRLKVWAGAAADGQLAGQPAQHQRLAGLERDVAGAVRLVAHFEPHLAGQAVDRLVALVDQGRGIGADRVRAGDAGVQRGDCGDRAVGRIDDRAALLAHRLQLRVVDVVQAVEALGQQAGRRHHLLAQRGRGRVDAGHRVQGREELVDAARQAGLVVAHDLFQLGQVGLGLRVLAEVRRGAPQLLGLVAVREAQQRADAHAVAGLGRAGRGTDGAQHRRLAGIALGLQVGDVLAARGQGQLRRQRAGQRVVQDAHGASLSCAGSVRTGDRLLGFIKGGGNNCFRIASATPKARWPAM